MTVKEIGRSGCKIVFDYQKNKVIKFSANQQYNQRLRKQYQKQKEFSDSFFKTPLVHNYSDTELLNSFSMDLIYGKNFFEYIIHSDSKELLNFSDVIVNYLNNNIANAKEVKLNSNILTSKIIDIENKINMPSLSKYFNFIKDNSFDSFLEGKCHGDFTLSNIIFNKDYHLIDFLDNIFESPIFDLIKIQQDTLHNYCFVLYNKYDYKIKIFLDYLNNKIEKDINIKYYNSYICLSILNLLRIIPYSLDIEKQQLIKKLFYYDTYITNSR